MSARAPFVETDPGYGRTTTQQTNREQRIIGHPILHQTQAYIQCQSIGYIMSNRSILISTLTGKYFLCLQEYLLGKIQVVSTVLLWNVRKEMRIPLTKDGEH